MTLLSNEVRQEVGKMLKEMVAPVKLVIFTEPTRCEYCKEIVQLAEEVASLSYRLSVEVYDFTQDAAQVAEYKIDKAPALAIVGAKDYGIRYFGLAAGYEFSTLLNGILAASHGYSDLDPETKQFLSTLVQPVDIQVFVTTSCPYCPRSAVLAYAMANVEDTPEDAQAFVERHGVTFPVVQDPDNTVAGQYNVIGLPSSYFVNQEGEIFGFQAGTVTRNLLNRQVTPQLQP